MNQEYNSRDEKRTKVNSSTVERRNEDCHRNYKNNKQQQKTINKTKSWNIEKK